MYKGTTPTLTLTLPQEVDLTGADVYITFCNEQKNILMTLKDTDEEVDVQGNVIELSLSQAQTLRLTNRVFLQVNWTYSGGIRACSNIVEFNVKRNLMNEVL